MMSKRPGYCEPKKDEEDNLYCTEDQLYQLVDHACRKGPLT